MAFLARDSTKVVAMEIECEFRLKPAMDSERMAIDCISAPSRPCLPMPQSARSTERRKLFCFAIGFFLSFMIRSLIQSNQGRESSVDDSAAEIAETPADRHFKPGESGNPAGRPRRAKNKTTLLAEEAMAEKVGAVADKLVERALAGSTSAIRQVLDRTMPVPRGCIGFDLPDLRGPRGIADAQEALIFAVAARQVPPRDADYAGMDLPQLIDAMWDAEEAERKGPSVPAETPPAEAQATDTGDPALDGALRPVEAEPIVTASADANHEINREIQVGAWSHPAVPFDETVLQGPHQRPRRWHRLTWSRVGSDRAIAPPSPADARRVRLPEGERRQLAAHRP